jgi:hypothetical protein
MINAGRIRTDEVGRGRRSEKVGGKSDGVGFGWRVLVKKMNLFCPRTSPNHFTDYGKIFWNFFLTIVTQNKKGGHVLEIYFQLFNNLQNKTLIICKMEI